MLLFAGFAMRHLCWTRRKHWCSLHSQNECVKVGCCFVLLCLPGSGKIFVPIPLGFLFGLLGTKLTPVKGTGCALLSTQLLGSRKPSVIWGSQVQFPIFSSHSGLRGEMDAQSLHTPSWVFICYFNCLVGSCQWIVHLVNLSGMKACHRNLELVPVGPHCHWASRSRDLATFSCHFAVTHSHSEEPCGYSLFPNSQLPSSCRCDL